MLTAAARGLRACEPASRASFAGTHPVHQRWWPGMRGPARPGMPGPVSRLRIRTSFADLFGPSSPVPRPSSVVRRLSSVVPHWSARGRGVPHSRRPASSRRLAHSRRRAVPERAGAGRGLACSCFSGCVLPVSRSSPSAPNADTGGAGGGAAGSHRAERGARPRAPICSMHACVHPRPRQPDLTRRHQPRPAPVTSPRAVRRASGDGRRPRPPALWLPE